MGGNDGETTETTREPPKNDQSLNACNFLNNGPIFNLKKFWKALCLFYQMTVETTGKRRKRWEEMTGGNDGETTETTREPPKNDQSLNACNFLNNGPIFNPKKVLESSWSPLPNDSRNDRETTETMGGNDRETTETTREPPKNDQSLNACNFLNNGPIFNPKKFWKALGLLYQMTVETMETTGGNDGRKRRGNNRNDEGTT